MKDKFHIFVRLNIDLRSFARAMTISYLNNMAECEANEWYSFTLPTATTLYAHHHHHYYYPHAAVAVAVIDKKQCFYDVKEQKLQ